MALDCSNGFIDEGQRANQRFNKAHGLTSREGGSWTLAGKTNIISNVMLVALFIIGIVASTGALSAAAAGWTAVGLGGGALLMQLLGGNLKERKIDLILAAVLAAGIITVGALGGAGVMTGAQVGYSLIGIVGAQALFWGCCCRALAAREVKQRQSYNAGA